MKEMCLYNFLRAVDACTKHIVKRLNRYLKLQHNIFFGTFYSVLVEYTCMLNIRHSFFSIIDHKVMETTLRCFLRQRFIPFLMTVFCTKYILKNTLKHV